MKVVDESRQKTTDLEEESALIAEALIKKAPPPVEASTVSRPDRPCCRSRLRYLGDVSRRHKGADLEDGTSQIGSRERGSVVAMPILCDWWEFWRVTDTGVRPAPVVSVGSLGLLVWQPCGWASGGWNANQQGLFVGISPEAPSLPRSPQATSIPGGWLRQPPTKPPVATS